jgi:hypothetical protein
MAFAIFAGIALFSIIFLYTKTADRWNWKKIVIWSGGIAIVPVVGFFLLAFSDQLLKDSPKNHKGLLTSFGGFSIGDNLSDIEFHYGKLKKPDWFRDEPYEVHMHPAGFNFAVNKSDSKVIAIEIECGSAVKDEFNGIACGDSSEKLQKRFGTSLTIKCQPKPKKESENVGDVYRLYAVDKFATRYLLSKNKVELIIIKPNPSESEYWVDCK